MIRKLSKKQVLSTAFLTLSFLPLPKIQAQEQFPAISLRGGFLLNSYSANFSSFQGAIDCGTFTTGNGNGVVGSLGFEYPITPKITISLGVGIADRSGSLTIGNGFPVRDQLTGSVVDVVTENSLKATLRYLDIMPEVRYTLLENLWRGPLKLYFSPRFSMAMTGTFTQNEQIVSPSGAAFTLPNGTRTRVREISSGTMNSQTKMLLGGLIGVEHHLQLSKNLSFTQQFSYDAGLSNIVTDQSWTVNGFKIEAGLRWEFIPSPKSPEIVPEQPKQQEQPKPIVAQQVVPEKPKEIPEEKPKDIPKPVVSLVLTLDDSKSSLEVGSELKATTPLVNTVFFEQNSAEIPSKYVRTGKSQKIYDPVEDHKQILLDIAELAEKNSNMRITLRGATSGADDEPQGLTLARARAESIKTALISLGISPKIIETQADIFPVIRSNQDYPEGREENRRVDIVVQNASLQEFVSKEAYAETKGSAIVDVQFQNVPQGEEVVVQVPLSENSVTITEPQKLTFPFSVRTGSKSEITVEAVAKALRSKAEANTSLDMKINTLPVKKIDLNLEVFEPIIRFDYNSAELTESNKILLREVIRVLPRSSTIEVLGSTDVLGSDVRNAELSARRAKVVEEFIRQASSNSLQVTSGNSTERFSDKVPEGRFLNRCIRIRVKK